VLDSTSVPSAADGSSRLSTWTSLYLVMAASVHVCDLGAHLVSVSRLDEGVVDSPSRLFEARGGRACSRFRIVLKCSE